jgi:hypothetical protein
MNTMVACKQAKRLIDEADRPNALSFEASHHLATCPDCESFASERARLRGLLASGKRVIVPMNFDAMLNARLQDAKGRTAFGWLSSVGYLRFGAAAAVLVIMAVAAQQGGLFSRQAPPSVLEAGNVSVKPTQPTPAESAGTIAGVRASGATTVINNPSPQFTRGNRGTTRAASAGVPLAVAGENYLHEDGGVMLVRGPNGEGEVSLPMVSVGAQSLVYASAGASRQAPRAIGASF